jgi:hypothetical protein
MPAMWNNGSADCTAEPPSTAPAPCCSECVRGRRPSGFVAAWADRPFLRPDLGLRNQAHERPAIVAKDHGATEWFHYTNNTDAIYEIMYGGTAAKLRKKWNLGPKANVRDNLTTDQLNTIIQIEGAITLQLEDRKITNPADQLRVVRHVALSYRTLIEAPLPLVGMTPSADDFIRLDGAASIQ